MRQAFLIAVIGIVMVATAQTALASFTGTDVFLPSVGANPGTPPAVWYTTVWVHNPNATAANVTFYLLERQANPTPMTFTDTIQPGDTARYENAVQLMFAQADVRRAAAHLERQGARRVEDLLPVRGAQGLGRSVLRRDPGIVRDRAGAVDRAGGGVRDPALGGLHLPVQLRVRGDDRDRHLHGEGDGEGPDRRAAREQDLHRAAVGATAEGVRERVRSPRPPRTRG